MASFQFGGLVEQVATTATAGGTTTLTNTSKQIQVFTGSLTQTSELRKTLVPAPRYLYLAMTGSIFTVKLNLTVVYPQRQLLFLAQYVQTTYSSQLRKKAIFGTISKFKQMQIKWSLTA